MDELFQLHHVKRAVNWISYAVPFAKGSVNVEKMQKGDHAAVFYVSG